MLCEKDIILCPDICELTGLLLEMYGSTQFIQSGSVSINHLAQIGQSSQIFCAQLARKGSQSLAERSRPGQVRVPSYDFPKEDLKPVPGKNQKLNFDLSVKSGTLPLLGRFLVA